MLNIKNQLFNVAIVSLLLAAPALAADGGTAGDGARVQTGHRGECAGGRGGHTMGFSDSQLEKMAQVKNQYLDKTASERTEMGTLHRQLRDVLSQSTIDRSRAESIQAKLNSIKGDLSTAKLDMRLDEIALLTPEQREKMHHRMLVGEALGGGHGRGHHRHHGGGGHFEHKGAPGPQKA